MSHNDTNQSKTLKYSLTIWIKFQIFIRLKKCKIKTNKIGPLNNNNNRFNIIQFNNKIINNSWIILLNNKYIWINSNNNKFLNNSLWINNTNNSHLSLSILLHSSQTNKCWINNLDNNNNMVFLDNKKNEPCFYWLMKFFICKINFLYNK